MKRLSLAAALCAGLFAFAAPTAPVLAAEADAPKTVQQMRQPIPLSLSRVHKVMGQEGVYLFDCNPEEIYAQSHIKGSIHTNVENWWELLPKDKKNSFLIFYCINRLCNVSFEASLVAIEKGYENVYVMPDGIQGWVTNGYEFEGTGRTDPGLN